MKRNIIKLLIVLLSMISLNVYADNFDKNNPIQIDGFTYYFDSNLKTAEIAKASKGKAQGDFTIPINVDHEGVTYTITSIGDGAFESTSLTSLTIPNTITHIGLAAFACCSSLTSATIQEGVTELWQTFNQCTSLINVTLPNSLRVLGDFTFWGCTSLTSIEIPDGVEIISANCFAFDSGLTSISFGKGLKTIDGYAFYSCNLISVTIPDNVEKIGDGSFKENSSLISVTLGRGIKSIGCESFRSCSQLSTIISYIEEPFEIGGKSEDDYNRSFDVTTFNNATLYVPIGTSAKYKDTWGWADFHTIIEGVPGSINPEKCANPIIRYNNGKLLFDCDTDGVTYHYQITNKDIKAGSGNEIQLSATYQISVYATKPGLNPSESINATLCWIESDPKTEGITNGVAQIPANVVLIRSEGGILKLEGIDDGTYVSVFTPDGKQAGSAVCRNGAALVGTNIQPGSAAIVKIGEKSVKVLVK